MALSRTDRGTGTGTGSASTSSFTPAANSLLILFSGYTYGVTGPLPESVISGGSLTWNLIGTAYGNASWAIRVDAYYAQVGGSPSSMTCTTNPANSSACEIAVIEFSGHDTGSPISGYVTSGTTDIGNGAETQTLATTPTADDVSLYTLYLDVESNPANPTMAAGWTKVYDFSYSAGYGQLVVARRESSTSTTVTCTDTYTAAGAFFKGSMLSFIVKALSGVTVNLSTATLAASTPALGVSAPPSGVSVDLSTATLSSSAPSSSVQPGDVSVSLSTVTLASSARPVTNDTITPLETFEGAIGDWAVTLDTVGTGSTVTQSSDQAYVGTYSAKCFTTNASAKAQVRGTFSNTWDWGNNTLPGVYHWQRARIYIPTATADAITGTEYLDIAAFYSNSSGTKEGYYLRLRAGAVMAVNGPLSTNMQAEFTLYDTFPLDQWVEVEMGLWTIATAPHGRTAMFLINGDPYGWYRAGPTGTTYDRGAMGILGTNSTDDLTVYVDQWYSLTTDANPSGTDNRWTSASSTLDFTDISGKNVDIQYTTWSVAGNDWLDATHGIGGFRAQASANEDRQIANLQDGWAEIECDWVDGVQPSWPPNEFFQGQPANTYFAVLIAFRKCFPYEENLEIVIPYNRQSDQKAELCFESWVISELGAQYAWWDMPQASVGDNAYYPEPGDKIRVRWYESSATNLQIDVDYYDASAVHWYLSAISDNRNLTNVLGANFLDSDHVSVSVTTETSKYSVRNIRYGTLATLEAIVELDTAVLTATPQNVVSGEFMVGASDDVAVGDTPVLSAPATAPLSVAVDPSNAAYLVGGVKVVG